MERALVELVYKFDEKSYCECLSISKVHCQKKGAMHTKYGVLHLSYLEHLI